MKVVLMTTVPMSLRFLRGHINMLQQRGAEVHVISSPGAQLNKFAADHGVTAHGIELRRSISPLHDVVTLWRLVRCLRSIRPDIVHAHTPKAGLLGILAARATSVPRRLYHIHGLPMETAGGVKRRVLRWCESIATRLAHKVFCVSNSLKRRVAAERICSSERLTVLANGTIDGIDAAVQFNPSRFSVDEKLQHRKSLGIPPGAAVTGFVGRIVNDKGIRELMAAFEQLQKGLPESHLLLVGAFERHQPLPHQLELAITTNPRVHITGFVDDPALYYAIMDVLALPTHREGFGLVAAEAAAMEVPVVATQVTGCVDAVRDGVTGTLVPPRDPSALAAAIANYLQDSDRRRVHGLSGRIRMLQEFRPQDVRDALWESYNEPPAFGSNRTATPGQNRRSYANCYKRWADTALAAAVLVILSPLILLIAILVRWRFGSPVIFWQQRPGLGGNLFWMPKFRTMTSAHDQTGRLLPDEQRLTRFGRFLRAASLDELPELWCVIRGQMSIVGPRPLLPEYLPLYTDHQTRRHEVRPGITGWAQVNGRNELAWADRFEHDVWYVDHCSVSLDAKILWHTIWQVATRRGISMAGHATSAAFSGNPSEHRTQNTETACEIENSVVVLGAGGHAKVVISALTAAGWNVAGVYDDDASKHGQILQGVEIRGPVKGLDLPRTTRAVIAIGDNLLRRAIASHFAFDWVAVIHPAAWVDPSATIEPGAVICAGAVIQPGCQIGRHAIINTLAGVDHDCHIGEFAHIAPGAHLAGGVHVGAGTLVGAGASAIPGVEVGEDSIIGAGAVVTTDVPSDVLAVGIPARIARELPSAPSVKKWTASQQAA